MSVLILFASQWVLFPCLLISYRKLINDPVISRQKYKNYENYKRDLSINIVYVTIVKGKWEITARYLRIFRYCELDEPERNWTCAMKILIRTEHYFSAYNSNCCKWMETNWNKSSIRDRSILLLGAACVPVRSLLQIFTKLKCQINSV